MLSTFGGLNAELMTGPRVYYAMAEDGLFFRRVAAVHPRYRTPHVSTWVIGALVALWYAVVNSLSENFLFDTLSALSLMIAFYYALSGFACVIYYRRELLKSVRNFLFIGVAPLLGGLLLAFLFVRSVRDLADPDASYSGGDVLGLGVPLVIGGSFLLLGALLSVLWRFGHPTGFFRRRGFEAVAPAPRG
jgi:amino acid transporter